MVGSEMENQRDSILRNAKVVSSIPASVNFRRKLTESEPIPSKLSISQPHASQDIGSLLSFRKGGIETAWLPCRDRMKRRCSRLAANRRPGAPCRAARGVPASGNLISVTYALLRRLNMANF